MSILYTHYTFRQAFLPYRKMFDGIQGSMYNYCVNRGETVYETY